MALIKEVILVEIPLDELEHLLQQTRLELEEWGLLEIDDIYWKWYEEVERLKNDD